MTELFKKQLTLFSVFGSALGIVAAIIVFLFTTFATRAEVEDKNNDVIEHLSDLKTDVRDIRNKLDQLLKR